MDETYKSIFEPVMGKCLETHRPSRFLVTSWVALTSRFKGMPTV